MKKVIDFIKLWAGKIWRFTQLKNFIYFWAILVFAFSFFVENSLFSLLGLAVSVVALLSNIVNKDDKEE